MLIIPVKEGENIDRALKRFKRKFDKTGTMRQLRKRQQFTKPSVERRQQIQKAQQPEPESRFGLFFLIPSFVSLYQYVIRGFQKVPFA